MATGYRQAVENHPARKVARLLLAKANATPPVDVEGLLRQLADLERVKLPVAGDAVVQRSPGRRPKVYLDVSPAPVRQRFTMAHEIGHLVLPWQPGTLVCHTKFSYVFDDDLVGQFEHEADYFASELLMPSTWIKEEVTVSRHLPFADLVASLATLADVSVHVATIAIPPLLGSSPAHLVLVEGSSGRILLSCATPGISTSIRLEGILTPKLIAQLVRVGAVHSKKSVASGNQLHAFAFPLAEVFVRPPKPSNQILEEILATLALSDESRLARIRRISGLVGSANVNTLGAATREERYGAFRRKFADLPDLLPVTSHRDFDAFLRAKAAEMHDRHGKKR